MLDSNHHIKKSITTPKTSLSYPLTVNKPVQQQPSHTSPQDPSGSSRPNNSNHQIHSSSQKSSTKSSLLSSKKNSSSSSSPPKPNQRSSLQRLSAGATTCHKVGSSGDISPNWSKKHSQKGSKTELFTGFFMQ